MGNSNSKKNYDSTRANSDRSARIRHFRAFLIKLGQERSDGDSMIHTATDGNEYFLDRLNSDGTQTRPTKEAHYTDSWREPKWTVTINQLIDAGNQGSFDLDTNNCLHATQRMVRKMGWLEELHRGVENYLPASVSQKLRRFKIRA